MTYTRRNWAQRRQIIRALIAESSTSDIDSFNLTQNEKIYFTKRSEESVRDLARKTAIFKGHYDVRSARPFQYVAGVAALIITFAGVSFTYLMLSNEGDTAAYPLLAASATIFVAAIGWWVGAWIAHRNAVRQNTTNIIFARFSQTLFAENMQRFHTNFKPTDFVSRKIMDKLRNGNDEDKKLSSSVVYLLNYYEFISSGVINGDLDYDIVKDNIRGVLIKYYDMCEDHILSSNKDDRRVFENIIKMRHHYRDPDA